MLLALWLVQLGASAGSAARLGLHRAPCGVRDKKQACQAVRHEDNLRQKTCCACSISLQVMVEVVNSAEEAAGEPSGAERRSKRARKSRRGIAVDSTHTLQVGRPGFVCLLPALLVAPRCCWRQRGQQMDCSGAVVRRTGQRTPHRHLCPMPAPRFLPTFFPLSSCLPPAPDPAQPHFPGAGGAPPQRPALPQARAPPAACLQALAAPRRA